VTNAAPVPLFHFDGREIADKSRPAPSNYAQAKVINFIGGEAGRFAIEV